MRTAVRKYQPEIVLHNGRPKAVIIDIEEYKRMLEELEDASDLKMLARIRKSGTRFRRFEDFLREKFPNV